MTGLAPVVRDYVASCVDKATSPLLARIKELEARPQPKDGKDADTESARRFIVEEVQQYIKALPPPPKDGVDGAPGRDGTDGKDAEPEMVASMVAAAVAKIPEPVFPVEDAKLWLADMVMALPPPKDGKDGKDGKNVDQAVVEAMIQDAAAKIPVPKDGKDGQPGKDGKDGKDADPVLIKTLVDSAVAEIPKPKDGVGALSALIDRDGCFVLTLTDGTTKNLGCVVGKDADPEMMMQAIKNEVAKIPVPKDGKDGRDGFGFDDMAMNYDGERTLTLIFTKGEDTKEIVVRIPVPIYRGVWRQGAYERGDTVTLGGSTFIAQRDTETKPETSKDWTLSVKRGGNGPSAYDAAKRAGFNGSETEWLASLKGDPGKKGDSGRDLTQMTLTGEKY